MVKLKTNKTDQERKVILREFGLKEKTCLY